MNTSTNSKLTFRYLAIGFIGAIICMTALFIYGVVIQSQGLMVVSSTIAVLSGAVWSSTYNSVKKKERESA